jgi:hypothetical protein
VSPGDNINAKIEALIDRSTIMIVELGSQWTQAELELAISRNKRNKNKTKLIIITRGPAINNSNDDALYVQRPTDENDYEELAQSIYEAIKIATENKLTPYQNEEASRLLEKEEYRAAVISSLAFLESRLRDGLGKKPLHKILRPMSLRSLIDECVNSDILTDAERIKLREWISTRNAAVHIGLTVSKRKAEEIVRGTTEIIQTLISKNPGA